MTDQINPLKGLESPAAAQIQNTHCPVLATNEIIALSTAISLKRIADALSGDDTWALNNLMENAGQAFALGMRGR